MRRTNPHLPAFRRSRLAFRFLSIIAILGFTCCYGIQDARAQIDGGDFGGLGGLADGGGGLGGDGGGIGGDGGGIGGDGGGAGGDDGLGAVLGGVTASDERNQGFVGPTGTTIQDGGFVGPPGEITGPPLADGASFGGGVNDVDLGGGAGGAGGGNQGNAGFGGAGQQGDVKGFEVIRRSVRANLRPQFAAPRVSGFEVSNRFQNRIRRQPSMANDGRGVQITMQGTTATINGFVGSAAERSRIERQLRLEPGVYRINNQAQVIGR